MLHVEREPDIIKLAEAIFTNWEDDNKSGSVTFHFDRGRLTKYHKDEYVKVN